MKTTNFGTMTMVSKCPGEITPLPGQTYFPILIEAVKNAQHTILTMQYQWNFYIGKPDNPVQQLNQALLNNIRSGLKCQVLLNKEGRAQQLTAINMKAQRYLIDAGASVKLGKTFPITHAKMWLIDDDITIIGSHNLSSRSFTVNNEVSALINSRSVNQELKRYFETLWGLL
jgi:phosphatidylserine/phosphatidylglycerophosphate/cardiolipin synthase-like enzyme